MSEANTYPEDEWTAFKSKKYVKRVINYPNLKTLEEEMSDEYQESSEESTIHLSSI